jgi:hypothetical protein
MPQFRHPAKILLLPHNFHPLLTVKRTTTLNMVYDTKPPYDEQSGEITVTEVSFVHPGVYDSTKERLKRLARLKQTTHH